MTDIETVLEARAGGVCELCGGKQAARSHLVDGSPLEGAASCLWMCEACEGRLGEGALDDKEWFGLRDAAWSEHLAVQVMSYRILQRLDAAWARDLASQIYFDDETRVWAELSAAENDDATPTLDSNGTVLRDGDSVTLIKDLEVKGGGFTAKRGTLVKGIRLTGDPKNIEGKVNKMQLVLKTEFLKKA